MLHLLQRSQCRTQRIFVQMTEATWAAPALCTLVDIIVQRLTHQLSSFRMLIGGLSIGVNDRRFLSRSRNFAITLWKSYELLLRNLIYRNDTLHLSASWTERALVPRSLPQFVLFDFFLAHGESDVGSRIVLTEVRGYIVLEEPLNLTPVFLIIRCFPLLGQTTLLGLLHKRCTCSLLWLLKKADLCASFNGFRIHEVTDLLHGKLHLLFHCNSRRCYDCGWFDLRASYGIKGIPFCYIRLQTCVDFSRHFALLLTLLWCTTYIGEQLSAYA